MVVLFIELEQRTSPPIASTRHSSPMQTPRMGTLPIPHAITSLEIPESVVGCPGPGEMTIRSRSPLSYIACVSARLVIIQTTSSAFLLVPISAPFYSPRLTAKLTRPPYAQTHLNIGNGDLVISPD